MTHFWEDFSATTLTPIPDNNDNVDEIIWRYYADAKEANPGGDYKQWLTTALNDVLETSNMGRYLLEQPLMQHLVRVQLARQGMVMTGLRRFTYGGEKMADGSTSRPLMMVGDNCVGGFLKGAGLGFHLFHDDVVEINEVPFINGVKNTMPVTYAAVTIAVDEEYY